MSADRLVLALFGATGRVGRRVLGMAIGLGHPVRALVRDPADLESHPSVTVIQGDVLDPSAVARTMVGTNAVISCLGNAGLRDPGVAVSQGTRHIVEAMRTYGVTRILNVAGGGILQAPDGFGLRSEQPTFPEAFRLTSAQHRLAWEALRDAELDWTTVATPDILDGDATGTVRVARDYMPVKGRAVTTGDVAAFLIRELTERHFVRSRVGMAN